jgi:hypothetical protein
MSSRAFFRPTWLILAVAAPLAAQQPPEPNGGPYVELREPHFVAAAKADFLQDGDRVVGVNENGVAKAYAVPVMAFHHIIQDRLKEMPILATW